MKVLFLDSWTIGVHNFLPLARELKSVGADCLLVHRGSWGNDPDRPDEEIIDGLLCRDVRYYRTNLLHKIFNLEKPDVVLLLTTNTFIDRATILSARALGIRSIFLMHGVVFVGDKREADMAGAESSHRAMRWKRAGKYLRYVLPNYLYSGSKADFTFPFTPAPYLLIWRSFANPAKYYWAPPPSKELQCDQALVWANVYREHYHTRFGYPLESICVVGPPPLDRAFELLDSPPKADCRNAFLSANDIPIEKQLCVYLETAAVEARILGWTKEARIEHFDEMIACAEAAGKYLVVKLHPSSSSSGLEKFHSDDRVKFIRTADLPMVIYAAESIIGFVSSTLDIAVALGKPILTPTWGISKNLPDDYLRFGVALSAESPEELISQLQNSTEILEQLRLARTDYIADYISITDGRATQRIVKALIR